MKVETSSVLSIRSDLVDMTKAVNDSSAKNKKVRAQLKRWFSYCP